MEYYYFLSDEDYDDMIRDNGDEEEEDYSDGNPFDSESSGAYEKVDEFSIVQAAESNINELIKKLDKLESDVTVPGIIKVLSSDAYNCGDILTHDFLALLDDSTDDDDYKLMFQNVVEICCRLNHLTGADLTLSDEIMLPFDVLEQLVADIKTYSPDHIYPFVLHVTSNTDYDVYVQLMRRMNG